MFCLIEHLRVVGDSIVENFELLDRQLSRSGPKAIQRKALKALRRTNTSRARASIQEAPERPEDRTEGTVHRHPQHVEPSKEFSKELRPPRAGIGRHMSALNILAR